MATKTSGPRDAQTPGGRGERRTGSDRDRTLPASDVYSHHRSLSTCHLANISIRLGRKLSWDPAKEEIVGDPEANGYLSREQRKGYETDA